jgi:ribosomal protein S1
MDEIKAVVTRVEKDKVVIDPLVPMVEDWLSPILKDPTIQKVIPNLETGAAPKPIKVKDLQLTKGGFTGKAVIPSVSEFVGEDYVMEAFIPGSQIVLNITDNFGKFNGATVDVFVMNYMSKPGSRGEMSLICSAKEVIKFHGEINMIKLFNSWCEDGSVWKAVADMTFEGKVTGVINSAKKCGVFIEIPELSITGMVATKPEELVNYKPHMEVPVKITGFDEETYFDYATQQVQHVLPYEIEDGVLKKCNLKPILQFA